MTDYCVWAWDFEFVGFLSAYTAEEALQKAKKRFKLALAPMVAPYAR